MQRQTRRKKCAEHAICVVRKVKRKQHTHAHRAHRLQKHSQWAQCTQCTFVMSEFDLLAAQANLKTNCWIVRQVFGTDGMGAGANSAILCVEMWERTNDYDIDDIECPASIVYLYNRRTDSRILDAYCGISSTTPKVLCIQIQIHTQHVFSQHAHTHMRYRDMLFDFV